MIHQAMCAFTGFDIGRNDAIGAISFDLGDGHLLLSRQVVDIPGDPGIYVEYNDQLNSGYGLISRCLLREGKIEIHVAKPLAGIDGFVITLDRVSVHLVPGLKQIFRNYEELLTIEAP